MDPIGIPGPVGDDHDQPQAQPEQPSAPRQPDWSGNSAAGQNSSAAQSSRPNQHQRGAARGRGRPRCQRRRRPLPHREGLLESLAALPQLVATGAIMPSQATSIRGVIETLLKELSPGQTRGHAGFNGASLRDAVGSNPQLLDFLAPLLSADELFELADDDDESEENHNQRDSS